MAKQPVSRMVWATLLWSLLVVGGCYSESSDQVTFDENDLLLEDELLAPVGEVTGSVPQGAESTDSHDGRNSQSTHSLVKRVSQSLSQSSLDGIETSQAQLTAWFDVLVEPAGGGDWSYRVLYRRLTYSEKVAGENQSYDSNDETAAVPASLVTLSEMVRSGFTFRTTGGGSALELTTVPSTLFSGDRKGAAAAEFIYDRIGLVLLARSAGSPPTAPALWTRKVDSPVPMEFSTRFSIKGSGQGTVTLDMLGSVAARQSTTEVTLVGGTAAVSLKGGYAFGDMTVDASNGVPRRADWNKYLDISMRATPSGDRIEQQKHEVVTIREAGAANSNVSTQSPGTDDASVGVPGGSPPPQPAGALR